MNEIGIQASLTERLLDLIVDGRAETSAAAQDKYSRALLTRASRKAFNQNFAARRLHGELLTGPRVGAPE